MTTGYRDAMIVWRNEFRPHGCPQKDAPTEPYNVTRSDVWILNNRAIVYIWFELIPAVPI